MCATEIKAKNAYEYVHCSLGIGQPAGALVAHVTWQEKPHSSHVVPWRVSPTISEEQ